MLLRVYVKCIQEQILEALRVVQLGGSTQLAIQHPVPANGLLAQITLVVTEVREDGYDADEIEAQIIPVSSYAGSHLAWQLVVRILISLSPPDQGWDRYRTPHHQGFTRVHPSGLPLACGPRTDREPLSVFSELIRLRRGDLSVITTTGLSRTSAEHLAEKITSLLAEPEPEMP